MGYLAQMKEGEMLRMKREPENMYDDRAIALLWKDLHIGYIPHRYNKVLARLIDTQALDLHAEITHLESAAATWENVHVAIYFLKERSLTASVPESAQYLTVLSTPDYTSIRNSENMISRVQLLQQNENIVVNTGQLDERFKAIRKKYDPEKYSGEDVYFHQKGMRILEDEDVETLLPFVKDVKEIRDDIQQVFFELHLS